MWLSYPSSLHRPFGGSEMSASAALAAVAGEDPASSARISDGVRAALFRCGGRACRVTGARLMPRAADLGCAEVGTTLSSPSYVYVSVARAGPSAGAVLPTAMPVGHFAVAAPSKIFARPSNQFFRIGNSRCVRLRQTPVAASMLGVMGGANLEIFGPNSLDGFFQLVAATAGCLIRRPQS